MALTYTYPDEYLSQRVTEDRETRAIAEVSELELSNQAFIDKLTILKAYIITSLESSATSDDTFNMKYKIYSKEYETELSRSIEDKKAVTGDSLFSVELGRN